MSDFDLVIFDCDGVLVDSERIANEIFAQIIFEECGLKFTQQQMFDTFVGRSMTQCMAIINQEFDCNLPANLAHRYDNDINNALQESVVAVNGIEQALQEIGIPYCVASSGSYEKMNITLKKSGLLPHFSGKLHSASEVARGKPHPDIYLYAARNMGFDDPSRCLVIEDSPTGVTGGVAAGMVVFGYAELMKEQKLQDAGAHFTFKDMGKLASYITDYKRR